MAIMHAIMPDLSWRSVPGEVRPRERSAHSRGALYRSTLYRNQRFHRSALSLSSPSLYFLVRIDERAPGRFDPEQQRDGRAGEERDAINKEGRLLVLGEEASEAAREDASKAAEAH